jgi:hypothetical protein
MTTTAIKRERPRFDINKEPENIQKRWVRKALLAYNHNENTQFLFEDVWGFWDPRDCGPQMWGRLTGRGRNGWQIDSYAIPKFPDFDWTAGLVCPEVEELLGLTCIGDYMHDWEVGFGDDIIRCSTEHLRQVLTQAYNPVDPNWTEDRKISEMLEKFRINT